MAVHSGHMRFRHQILLLLLSITLVMMVIAVLVAVPAAFNAQQRITFDQLNSVSNLKTLWVKREFDELERGLVALADNVAVVDEVRAIGSLLPGPADDQSVLHRIPGSGGAASAREAVTGSRESLYWQSQRRLYANFRFMDNSFPDSQVLLIRPRDGLVLFTLRPSLHLMERIGYARHGALPLYRCYRQALKHPRRVVFEDSAVDDAGAVHRACAARAVFAEGKMVAVIAHLFTSDLINGIMALRPGLGETGETYLVGPDKLMRTESRFGGAASIFEQFVDSQAVREGLLGEAGSNITTNYRGARVFSVWQPIQLDAIHWALIAEIEEDESYGALRATIAQLLLVWWIGFMALIVAAYAFARRTERPLLALVRNARRMAHGDFSADISESVGSRELRDLVRSFNHMAAQIRERTGALEAARQGAEQASWQADQASRAKSDFLSKMSHELRTPLNGVLGYVQILKRDRDMSENQQGTLSAIENCGQHLLELINDVLDISRIESGKLDLDLRPTHMQRLVQRVVDVVRPRAAEKGLRFEVDCQQLPVAIQTDAMRLRQILINLLGNAVKFTDSGHVCLRASHDEAASTLTFNVEDSGQGIPAHRLDEIFGPFAQTISGKRAGGAGLGLAISRQLSVALGGELRAVSEAGVGSVFSLDLPYIAVDRGYTAEVQSGDSIHHLPARVRRTALVADDNVTNRDIMVQLLSDAGFDTLEAGDGEVVLEVIESQPVDLILMDIRMPVMDGLTACRLIRESGRFKDLKIIAVSATVLTDLQAEAFRSGCDAFLAKPVDAQLLFAEIETQLGLQLSEPSEAAVDAPAAAGERLVSEYSREALVPVFEQMLAALQIGDVGAARAQIAALEALLGTGHELPVRLARLAGQFEMQALKQAVQRNLELLREAAP